MSETIISIEKVSKYFEDNSVLRDVNFEIFKGEFLCLVGPSGCGKSTLLRILLDFEKADSGKIEFSKAIRKSLVFQNFALFPWLSVEDNIAFGLKMVGIDKAKIKQKVTDVIHDLGLSGSEKLHPKELSGGMKQRVGIGRALVMDPDILFLDEPFSAVDAFTARDLRKKLLEIWAQRHITIVMVTHLVEEAIELSDRIVVLGNDKNKGSVIEVYKNELTRPRDNRSREFFNKVDEIENYIF
jgi:NitT/TauT family transport system ATP-binding protein